MFLWKIFSPAQLDNEWKRIGKENIERIECSRMMEDVTKKACLQGYLPEK